MRARQAQGAGSRCPQCYLRPEWCVCGTIEPVHTDTRFVVVRHQIEAHKTTNSARLVLLALKNAEILSYAARGQALDPRMLSRPGTWLLFPEEGCGPPPQGRPDYLVVLDGSWSQARKMLHRIEALRGLPRLGLPPLQEARPRIRAQHLAEGRSTLEAVADAVAHLEGAEKAAPIHALNRRVIERVFRASGKRLAPASGNLDA